MSAIVLLGSFAPRSAAVWAILFGLFFSGMGLGYAIRSFRSFCRRYPTIRKRHRVAMREFIRLQARGGAE